MKVKRVIIEGFHNVSSKIYDFESVNYLHGKNGAGKSTVLQAIQLGLLGYVPGSNKTSKGVFAHANSNTMSIVVILVDDNNNQVSVQRVWNNGKATGVTVIPESYSIDKLISDLELPLFNFDEFSHLTANKLKDWFINYLPKQTFTTDWDKELRDSVKDLPSNVVDDSFVRDSVAEISRFGVEGVEEIRQANAYFKNELAFMKKELERKSSTIQSLIHYDDYVELYSEDELKQMIKNTENSIISNRLALQSRSRISAIQNELKTLEGASDILKNTREKYSEVEKQWNEAKEQLSALEYDSNNITLEYRSYDSVVNSQGVCPYTKSLCDEISALRDSYVSKRQELSAMQDSYSSKILDARSKVSRLKNTLDKLSTDIRMYEHEVNQYSKLTSELASLDADFTIQDTEILESQLESYKEMYGKAVANRRYSELSEILLKDKYRIQNSIDCLKLWVKLTDVNGLQASGDYNPFDLLSDSINRVLTQLFGLDTAVKFNSENKANSFSFGVERNNIYVPYNLLSSGEKCMFILSMYIGLLEYTKSPLKLILIDDFLDHLDDENFISIFKVLRDNTSNQYIFAGVKSLDIDPSIESICNVIEI